MAKRFLMLVFTLVLAVTAILIAAIHPTGPNTVSYDEPAGLWLSIGMVVVLFLPLFLLSYFNYLVVKIISALCQSIIVLSFLTLIPIGIIAPNGFWLSMIGMIGTIVSILSIVVTIMVGLKSK